MRMTYNKQLAYYKFIKFIGNKKSWIFSDGFYKFDTDKLNMKNL